MFLNFLKHRKVSKLQNATVKPKHMYYVRGFIRNPLFDKSFNYDWFLSRADAEKYMYNMIERYDLTVETNEFVDKHTNEIVCNSGRFTIARLY